MTQNGRGRGSSKDPLHSITLEMIVTRLVDYYGWEKLGSMISINCFTINPSIKSSLTFLRRTPWARKKVETLYLNTRFAGYTENYHGTGRQDK